MKKYCLKDQNIRGNPLNKIIVKSVEMVPRRAHKSSVNTVIKRLEKTRIFTSI